LLCFSLANHRHAGYRAAEKGVREAGGVAGKIVLLS
jgi:hypothetical protein